MAKKVSKPKPQTISINPNQPQPPPKPKRQVGQYDKIFQENLTKLLPLLIKEVLGMDVVHREQLPIRIQHTQEREPDILERVQLRDNTQTALHIEVQLKDENDMNIRLADYYLMLYRIDPNMPIEQYVVYIGNEKSKNITGYFQTDKMTHHYHVISFSDIPYELFLHSNIPEIIVFALLGDLGTSSPKNVAIEAAQRINAVEKGELRKKKFFKQLRIVANIRNLAPIIDKVMENIAQYFVPERDPWFNKGFQQGEQQGEEKKDATLKREFTVRLLVSTDFSNEKIALLVGDDVTAEYVEAIKKEVTQIRILLEARNSITKTAHLTGLTFDYVKKIKEALDNP